MYLQILLSWNLSRHLNFVIVDYASWRHVNVHVHVPRADGLICGGRFGIEGTAYVDLVATKSVNLFVNVIDILHIDSYVQIDLEKKKNRS